MSLQLSATVRDARLDAIETAIGTAPILRIYDLTAGAPANCAAAITATLLAEMTLPSDWMAGASGGSKAKAGTWEDASANGTGTADFWRIYASDGTTCTLGGVTVAGAAGVAIAGAGEVAAGPVGLSSAGQVAVAGAASMSLAGVTVEATGTTEAAEDGEPSIWLAGRVAGKVAARLAARRLAA